jgi:hypothetical protein
MLQVLAISWMDLKQVRLLSTFASAGTTEKELCDGSTKIIPTICDNIQQRHGWG